VNAGFLACLAKVRRNRAILIKMPAPGQLPVAKESGLSTIPTATAKQKYAKPFQTADR